MDCNPIALVDPWGASTEDPPIEITAKDKGPKPESKGLEPVTIDVGTLSRLKHPKSIVFRNL